MFRFKIIDAYVFKELFFSLILSVLAVNIILMMEKILRVTSVLSDVGASVWDFTAIVLLIQPQLLLLTLPMSFMISVLFTYSRLNMDNEAVILRASGMSFASMIKPVLVLASLCFLLCLLVSFYLGPQSSNKLRLYLTQLISTKAPLAIKPGVFHTLFSDIVIFVREKPTELLVKDVFIYDKRDKQRPWAISASYGEIEFYKDMSVGLKLTNGEVFLTQGAALTKINFDVYNMTVKITPDFNIKLSEYTPLELLFNASFADVSEKNAMLLEFYRRLTFPLLNFLIYMTAPCFTMTSRRAGRLGGLSLGFGFFIVYYSVLVYFENLAKSSRIAPFLGGWSAFIIALAFSLYLFIRRSRQ
ncbi:putative permease YjgP/YjgQ [Candidatus Magnetoovum chiemensis]|nr:putative permease YjgP/YjgQ [Candidatus Magnetoovum chiemensis]